MPLHVMSYWIKVLIVSDYNFTNKDHFEGISKWEAYCLDYFSLLGIYLSGASSEGEQDMLAGDNFWNG